MQPWTRVGWLSMECTTLQLATGDFQATTCSQARPSKTFLPSFQFLQHYQRLVFTDIFVFTATEQRTSNLPGGNHICVVQHNFFKHT